MNQVPTKIVLKSTTRMSLNDRFSNIVPNVQSIRANKVAEHQVSAANRRLAQQLANRPGISQNQVNNMMYNNNNNSNNLMRGQGRGRRGGGNALQNRVGRGNIKARLTLPPKARGGGGQRGGRGGGIQNYNNNNNNNMSTSPFNKPRGRGVLSARSPRGRGGFRGGRGGQQFNRDNFNGIAGGARENSFRSRGGRQRPPSRGQNSDRYTGQATGRGGGGRGGAGGNQRGGARGGFNNNRGGAGGGGRYFSRGGRGRGRGGRGGGAKTSVDDLDSQLDQYMAKTKSSLDSELDAYMAQVSTD